MRIPNYCHVLTHLHFTSIADPSPLSQRVMNHPTVQAIQHFASLGLSVQQCHLDEARS